MHVGAPDGPLFSRSGPSGLGETGEWVFDGIAFYLQDASDGHPNDPAHTLDMVKVTVLGGRWQDGGDVPVGRVRFGDLDRLTPVCSDWGFDRGTPVMRYYIERFLSVHAADVRGAVLEVGDDAYTRRFGGDMVIRRDVLNVAAGHAGTTILADLADAPGIPSGSFDCVICAQTLQLIYNLDAAVRTLYRILKPGGVLLASVPGVAPTCGSWRDVTYWKFTPLTVRTLLEDAFGHGSVSAAGYGNAKTAVAALHGLVTADLAPADLDHDEPGYEVVVTVRVVKSAASHG